MNAKKMILLGLIVGVAVSLAQAASGEIFNDHANARQQIAAAITEASRSHKNIVLDFGANWCPDCHALDAQMRRGELGSIIKRSFVVVPISVGRWNINLDVAREYGVPLSRGIPALAILDSHGKLLYSMKQGQFADARSMNPSGFVAFFKKWEPKR
ncbi:MAG TPA: thioredoxin family protein [Terriglobia bacterium]|nr:thioredoxin family protein [Terriglobia bacterium]